MTENQDHIIKSNCLNCHVNLPENALYCHQCGQKNTDGLISLKEFIQNFFENVFNIDSRIVQTMKWLCIPAKLTKEYFKGKHRTYYHPIRLYLVMSIIFFAILSIKDSDASMVNINIGEELSETAHEERFKIEYAAKMDTISQQIIATNGDPIVKTTLDSLKQRLLTVKNRDSIDLTLNFDTKLKVDLLDIMTMKGKEIIEKYHIEGFWNKIFVKQGIHFVRDQAAFSRQVVSNLPLMLLVMMPALALFLKLLYIRKNRFFVEHLVLNFHHHALMFFLLSILFLFPESQYVIVMPIGFLGIFLFLFLAMKWYYGQGYFKTFVKFLLFNIFYILALIFSMVFTFIISFLLF